MKFILEHAVGDLSRGPRAGIKRFFAPALEAAIGPDLREARDFDAALATALGRPVRLAHGWLEAILAEPHMVMILHVPVGTALLSTWWVSSIDGVPAIVTQMLYPGDYMNLRFDGEQA